jgi:hypothetical protein
VICVFILKVNNKKLNGASGQRTKKSTLPFCANPVLFHYMRLVTLEVTVSNLRNTIVLLVAQAVDNVIEAIVEELDQIDGAIDDSEPDEEFDEDDEELDTLLSELLTPEVKPDLWANPPAPAATWPNTGAVQKKDLWANPPAPAATWPNTQCAPNDDLVKPVWPRISKPVTATTVANPPKATATASRQNVLRVTVGRDQRSRACVPNNLTKAVGIKPLDFVYIAKRAHGAQGLVILRKVAKTGHLSTYRVDKDGNIRLSDNLLSRGGLGRCVNVKFRTANSGDSIIVLAG